MESYWILIIIALLSVGILINWLIDSSEDFSELIKNEFGKFEISWTFQSWTI